jgi:uncharacterized protein (TIGR03083 family)
MRDRALVHYDQLLGAIGAEGERLAESATGQRSDLEVPSCPGLTLGDTVRHVGSVYRMVLDWLRTGARPTAWQREPDEGQSVEDYLLTGLRAIVDHLAAHDPQATCPTWWPEHPTYGFWDRRLAHETTVHRIDVQGAARIPLDSMAPIAEDLLVDGVDEVLSLWFVHRLDVLGVAGTRHGRVAVRTGGRYWIARATPQGTSAWRATPDELADATVSGDPKAVFLWLWGRVPHHLVDQDGDLDAIAQLWALLRLATR